MNAFVASVVLSAAAAGHATPPPQSRPMPRWTYDWDTFPIAWNGENATGFMNETGLDDIGAFALVRLAWRDMQLYANYTDLLTSQIEQCRRIKRRQGRSSLPRSSPVRSPSPKIPPSPERIPISLRDFPTVFLDQCASTHHAATQHRRRPIPLKLRAWGSQYARQSLHFDVSARPLTSDLCLSHYMHCFPTPPALPSQSADPTAPAKQVPEQTHIHLLSRRRRPTLFRHRAADLRRPRDLPRLSVSQLVWRD